MASSAERSQQDGAIATGYRYGARVFGFKGDIVSSDGTPATYQALRQAIMYALRPTRIEGDEMVFTLITGETRRLRYVVCTDFNADFPENEPSYNWNSFAAVFRASFPFFEGEEHSGTQQVTSIDGGMAIPAALPGVLGGPSVAGGPATYLNAGNAPAFPIFTITGPGTNFTVTNRTNGMSFTITTTLVAGDTIEIDTVNHTVTKNGTQNITSTFSGDWITLDGGAAGASTQISFTTSSGDTTDTTLTTEFFDTYLAI